MELSQLNDHNLKPVFFRYVINSVIGMAGVAFNVFTDTFFIANGIGSTALAALNIALPMFSLLSAVALMNGIGCAARYTMIKAGKNSHDADEIFTHGLMCALVLSLLFFVTGFFFAHPLAQLLGADASIVDSVSQYLFPFVTFGFLFIFNQLFVCMVRNDNEPSLSMKAMVLGNLMNIILDYIFIYKFHWGLFGASLATCFSPLTSMLILSTHKFRRKNNFHLVKTKLSFDIISQIIRVGMPSFINEISSGIVMLAFNYLLLKYGGNIAIAAYGIIANLALIVQAIYTGVGQGIQPLISYLYGCGKHHLVMLVAKYAIIVSILLGVIFTGSGYLIPQQLIAIFNGEGNMELAMIAANGIHLYFPAFLFSGCSIALTSVFSSMHKVVESNIVSLGRGLIFILGFLLILPVLMAENGVWLSVPAAEIVAFVLALYYFKCIYRNIKTDN